MRMRDLDGMDGKRPTDFAEELGWVAPGGNGRARRTAVLEPVQFRPPSVTDGASLWELARDTGLDLNSPYSYLMLCQFFADTCVVAERDSEIVGFVTGFRPPAAPDVVFVWQVGVASSERGNGLGGQLLRELLRSEACADVHYLEATVTPSNLPSRKLFRGLARDLGTGCEERECFSADLFPGESHEAEVTFRIGPY